MNLEKQFLIMDMKKCIDCDNCVIACTRRHSISRFQRYGYQIGSIRIPTSCKNCEDPECIATCPVGGMTKTNHRFTQPSEICTGCGACARKCPFNAIEMEKAGLVTQRIHYEKIEVTGAKVKLLEKAQNRKKEVWKCDGCAGYKNRGCVYNCPTGALQEVVLKDFIKTLPLVIAEKLVQYLSPAFLTAEEKGMIKRGEAVLTLNPDYEVKLELKVEEEEVLAKAVI